LAPPPLTFTIAPGAVVPVKLTSDAVKPATGTLKKAANTIGTTLVGSA
jgi:hypothetical protein